MTEDDYFRLTVPMGTSVSFYDKTYSGSDQAKAKFLLNLIKIIVITTTFLGKSVLGCCLQLKFNYMAFFHCLEVLFSVSVFLDDARMHVTVSRERVVRSRQHREGLLPGMEIYELYSLSRVGSKSKLALIGCTRVNNQSEARSAS